MEHLRAQGEKEGWLLSSEQVELGKVLGKGSFGETCSGLLANKQVAVKSVRIYSQSEAKSFGRELSALSKLQDPNVITFHGAVVEPPKASWLVTEYLPGGTLAKWIHGDRRNVAEKLNMAIGIAKGMQALESSIPPILHRDLKPSNVMLTAQNTPKVIDFGLCREYLETEADMLTSKTGSFLYMSPEMIRREDTGETYNLRTDMFSFGVMLNEIMCQKTPYEEMHLKPAQVAKAVAFDNLRPHLAPHLPPELAALVKACWSGDPAERPTFAAIVQQLQGILQATPADNHHHHLFHRHH